MLLVTGGSRGIGAAIVRMAVAADKPVAFTYAHDAGTADALVAELTASGGRALAIRADAGVEDDIVRAFVEAEAALGKIVALVNNAGITGPIARVEAIDGAMLARLFAINVAGPMLCAREAVRRMSTRHGGEGGRIVNISSRAAQLGGAGEWVHYAATKGAIDAFTIGLAREVAAEGIRVNAVAAGIVDTGLHAGAGDPERATRLGATIPLGRAATPAEIAEAIVWLASPAASYVTGSIVEVGGGR